jgi:hypothetical protein
MVDPLKTLNSAVSAYNVGKLVEAEQLCQKIVIAPTRFL